MSGQIKGLEVRPKREREGGGGKRGGACDSKGLPNTR